MTLSFKLCDVRFKMKSCSGMILSHVPHSLVCLTIGGSGDIHVGLGDSARDCSLRRLEVARIRFQVANLVQVVEGGTSVRVLAVRCAVVNARALSAAAVEGKQQRAHVVLILQQCISSACGCIGILRHLLK